MSLFTAMETFLEELLPKLGMEKSKENTMILAGSIIAMVLSMLLLPSILGSSSPPSGSGKSKKASKKNKKKEEVPASGGSSKGKGGKTEAKPKAVAKKEKAKAEPAKPTKAEKKAKEAAQKAAEKKAAKKAKKKAAPKKPPAPVARVVDSDSDSDSDSDTEPAPAPAPAPASQHRKKKPDPPQPPAPKLSKAEVDDGWAVASSKKKAPALHPVKRAAAERAAAAAAAGGQGPTTGANDTTDTVTVPANKIGIIIGPAGATIKAVMEGSGAKIDMEDRDRGSRAPATVTITGPPGGVAMAKAAIRQLATKGYCSMTQEKGFEEGGVQVPPNQLHEIIGKKGAVISVIQDRLKVKLSIPKTEGPPQADHMGRIRPVKVGIAGTKEQMIKAKAVIKDIMKFHHSELTHPGMGHEEVVVPDGYMSYVIGPRGSEMRHIQSNFHVDVHTPKRGGEMENVVVVGLPDDVKRAKAYILKVMERADEAWANQTGGEDDQDY